MRNQNEVMKLNSSEDKRCGPGMGRAVGAFGEEC